MALITDKILLNPKATGSLPGTDEGSLAYDSTTDQLKVYGTSWLGILPTVQGQKGSGGNIKNVDDWVANYTIHAFLNTGTFVVSGAALTCDILIVAGGGGVGFTQYHNGGGGAGGLVFGSSVSIVPGSYSITVGEGGKGSQAYSDADSYPRNGGDSTCFGITALGGGAGSYYGMPGGAREAQNGGSGGGGIGNGGTGTGGDGNQDDYSGTAGWTGYGNDGRDAVQSQAPAYGGGGGGGAGGAAPSYTGTADGGPGGVGLSYVTQFGDDSSINGGLFAGGGGGGAYAAGSGGTASHGGGAGSTGTGNPGAANSGGGAGGGERASNTIGQNGGSGIVLIRYLT